MRRLMLLRLSFIRKEVRYLFGRFKNKGVVAQHIAFNEAIRYIINISVDIKIGCQLE